MATIAIGDVHGNRAALDDLLMCLDGELGAADTVVFLGDYIDRGPDSKGCIDRILRFRAESRASVVAASIGIDTISHGILTAFRLPDRRVFQSARFT